MKRCGGFGALTDDGGAFAQTRRLRLRPALGNLWADALLFFHDRRSSVASGGDWPAGTIEERHA